MWWLKAFVLTCGDMYVTSSRAIVPGMGYSIQVGILRDIPREETVSVIELYVP